MDSCRLYFISFSLFLILIALRFSGERTPHFIAFSPRAAVHDSLQPKNFLRPDGYKDSRFRAILSFSHGASSSLQPLLRVRKTCPSFPALFPRDSASPQTLSQWELAPGRSRSSRAPADPCAALIAWGRRAKMSVARYCRYLFHYLPACSSGGTHTQLTPPVVPDQRPCSPRLPPPPRGAAPSRAGTLRTRG